MRLGPGFWPLTFASTVLLTAAAAGQSRSATSITASARSRVEVWNWFDQGPEGRYAFLGSLFRIGMVGRQKSLGWQVEVATPMLYGLPTDATRPAPQGQLGLGAAYAAANDGDDDEVAVFLKQAVLRFGAAGGTPGHYLKLGRFELIDGAESIPADPSLAALKRDRIAHRLLGNFGFSHVGRSFDGGGYGFGRNGLDVTLVGGRPTRGVFRTNGWGELDVWTFYGAVTVPVSRSTRSPSDLRLYALHYRDHRSLPATDNRPSAVRLADSSRVAVTTVGGHFLQLLPTAAGPIDLLAWGAWQTGGWAALDHRATAVALEAGFQPSLPSLRPWLRLGYYRGSGDDDPADGRHGTFFQVLPTPRSYARTPFYNGMNSSEIFASVLVRPAASVTIRSDLRRLDLAEPADLWYSGGGAFEPGSFGYAGRPSNGRDGLASLLDLSAELRLGRQITVTGYLGRMVGRDVVEAIYGDGARGTFGYLELELRR